MLSWNQSAKAPGSRISSVTRRRPILALLALPVLQGCADPLPALESLSATPDARALLDDSAAAHGSGNLAKIGDISLRTAGTWRPVVNSLQPLLVDAGFRGGSEQRLLPHQSLTAQAHTGPSGRKQVVRTAVPVPQGRVSVWFNGEEAQDTPRRAAAALVADGYNLFLFGPMLLAREPASGRRLTMAMAGMETLTLDGQQRQCDVLRVRIAPGLGFSEADELALFIDREERLMRRVRFTLEGLESTRGAVAEVDTFDHIEGLGIRWPTRFHERLLRPVPLPVHDWRLTGFDLNRGLSSADVSGPMFVGRAITPATTLA